MKRFDLWHLKERVLVIAGAMDDFSFVNRHLIGLSFATTALIDKNNKKREREPKATKICKIHQMTLLTHPPAMFNYAPLFMAADDIMLRYAPGHSRALFTVFRIF